MLNAISKIRAMRQARSDGFGVEDVENDILGRISYYRRKINRRTPNAGGMRGSGIEAATLNQESTAGFVREVEGQYTVAG
jgi:hypothetical protein